MSVPATVAPPPPPVAPLPALPPVAPLPPAPPSAPAPAEPPAATNPPPPAGSLSYCDRSRALQARASSATPLHALRNDDIGLGA